MVFSKSSIEIYFLEIEINLGYNTDLHSQITIINMYFRKYKFLKKAYLVFK